MKKLYVVKKSSVHGKGVFAKDDIEPGVDILEYKGIKVSKAKSSEITEKQMEKASKDESKGQVYMFELNKRYDLDGNIPGNDAKLINHSCTPNCETDTKNGKIWITSIRPIAKGEELSYNYGFAFDPEDYTEHVCKCGSKNCVGYIIAEDDWPKLAAHLLKRHKKVLKAIKESDS